MNLNFDFEHVSINYSNIIKTHFTTCEQNFLFLHAFRDSTLWPIFFLAATVFVASIGIIGNSLNIYVFVRKKAEYSHLNPLLIGLSISDLFVSTHEIVVVALPQIILTLGFPSLWKLTEEDAKSIMDMKMFLTYTWLTSCLSSMYFIVGISTERFIAVYWPLKTASILTSTRTRRLAIFIGTFALILNSPLLIYDFVWMITGKKKWNCFLTPYYKFPLAIFGILIPIPCIVIFNSIIIWKLIKNHKQRQQLTQQELDTFKITKMLVWIMSIFVLCIGLGGIDVFFIHDSLIQFQIIQFTITFNSCVNYFIYCAFRKGFRETLFLPRFLLYFCTKKARAVVAPHGHSCDSQKGMVAGDHQDHANHEDLHRLN